VVVVYCGRLQQSSGRVMKYWESAGPVTSLAGEILPIDTWRRRRKHQPSSRAGASEDTWKVRVGTALITDQPQHSIEGQSRNASSEQSRKHHSMESPLSIYHYAAAALYISPHNQSLGLLAFSVSATRTWNSPTLRFKLAQSLCKFQVTTGNSRPILSVRLSAPVLIRMILL